jgi:hypothetical protein
MPVPVPISIIMVTFEIIIPVMMDSRERVPMQTIGYLVVINRLPWPVIIRGRIPDVPTAEIVGIVRIEKIVRYTCRNIKPQFRRLDEFRRFLYNHRLRGIRRRSHTWVSEINPNTETHVGSINV